MLGAEEMERHVRFVADHPAVVTGTDVKKIASLHFIIASVIHLARGGSGNDEADVLDLT
jgi:hypothetical protein